jgi:hypothetical protein
MDKVCFKLYMPSKHQLANYIMLPKKEKKVLLPTGVSKSVAHIVL